MTYRGRVLAAGILGGTAIGSSDQSRTIVAPDLFASVRSVAHLSSGAPAAAL